MDHLPGLVDRLDHVDAAQSAGSRGAAAMVCSFFERTTPAPRCHTAELPRLRPARERPSVLVAKGILRCDFLGCRTIAAASPGELFISNRWRGRTSLLMFGNRHRSQRRTRSVPFRRPELCHQRVAGSRLSTSPTVSKYTSGRGRHLDLRQSVTPSRIEPGVFQPTTESAAGL